GSELIDAEAFALAAAIAAHSLHPYSRALVAGGESPTIKHVELMRISEHAGRGLEAHADGHVYRLGHPEWALTGRAEFLPAQTGRVVLAKDGRLQAAFEFDDRMRAGVRETVAELTGDGIAVEILSGDREDPVRQLASALAVPYVGRISPGGKVS